MLCTNIRFCTKSACFAQKLKVKINLKVAEQPDSNGTNFYEKFYILILPKSYVLKRGMIMVNKKKSINSKVIKSKSYDEELREEAEEVIKDLEKVFLV